MLAPETTRVIGSRCRDSQLLSDSSVLRETEQEPSLYTEDDLLAAVTGLSELAPEQAH